MITTEGRMNVCMCVCVCVFNFIIRLTLEERTLPPLPPSLSSLLSLSLLQNDARIEQARVSSRGDDNDDDDRNVLIAPMMRIIYCDI